MGQGRTRKLPVERRNIIAKNQSKKNARRKKRKAENAGMRESGEKFGKTDYCYRSAS